MTEIIPIVLLLLLVGFAKLQQGKGQLQNENKL
jgi:hypothetical protein